MSDDKLLITLRVDVLLDDCSEKLDFVVGQEFRDGEGADGRHENHHHTAQDARHR